jgi:hypothetical protein
MKTESIEKKKKKPVPKGVIVFKEMLDDKKAIGKHLRNGGTFKELKEKGYQFATV